MQDEEVKHYIRHLKDYKYYLNKLKRYETVLEDLQTQRNGVHSIRYDQERVQGSQDPHMKFLKEDDLRERLIEWSDKVADIKRRLNEIEAEVESMNPSISDSVMRVYCLQETTFSREARRKFMSETTLKRKVVDEIKKAVRRK